MPATVPITRPRRIHRNPMICWSSSVAPMARSIPSAPMAFPRRAVLGEDSSFTPTMNRTAATRYVSEMTSAMLRVGSAFIGPPDCRMLRPSFPRSRRATEHTQHSVGHEEATDDVDRRQGDRGDAEDLVVRGAETPGDND